MSTTLTYRDKIAVPDLGDGENRFTPDFLAEVNAHLDRAVADGAGGFVTTASGKFYSNGLGLDWLMANGDRTQEYVADVQALVSRVLTLPMPSVAAISGHAFGGGAMLAIAHDFRVMRADRGYFCFPESDIDTPFSPGMAALIQAKLSPQTAVASMTTGRRFGGNDALSVGIVDAVAAEGASVDAAVEILTPLDGKSQDTLGAIKNTMFTPAIAALAGN